MRRLILQQYVTLDGYAAGPGDDLSFFETVADAEESTRDNLELLRSVDTMLLGATTYRLFVEFWPTATDEPIAPLLNDLNKVVISSTLKEAPWGDREPATVLRGDAAALVADLKRQEGKDIVLWGSISLSYALLAAGLIDEIQLRVCPILVGAGKPAFQVTDHPISLNLAEARPYASGGALLQYLPKLG